MAGRASRYLALAGAVLAVAGCGGGGDSTAHDSGLPAAGSGGSLSYAVPSLPATLDPLQARDRAALTITRQIHEPLVERIAGPYGDTEQRPGLALAVKPSADQTVWTVTLRSGVRFQDGTPFNASAVLANARRWSTVAAGRRLLPHLFAVDAPRPDEVRFLLDAPVPELRRRLASPQLGIVSPRALAPGGGEHSRYEADAANSGTGPFTEGTGSPQRLELTRYAGWWGTPARLGPALDAVSFVAAPSAAERLRLLQADSVQVADSLGPAALATAAADPLLIALGAPGPGIGLEGSVRGIDSAGAVPILSRVWLTDLVG